MSKYNQLMKDFPINELLSAPDMEKIKEALVSVFGHLNKKLKLSPYPVRRALVFVEAISNDFLNQLLKVLGNRRLMSLAYNEYEQVRVICSSPKNFTSKYRISMLDQSIVTGSVSHMG